MALNLLKQLQQDEDAGDVQAGTLRSNRLTLTSRLTLAMNLIFLIGLSVGQLMLPTMCSCGCMSLHVGMCSLDNWGTETQDSPLGVWAAVLLVVTVLPQPAISSSLYTNTIWVQR